MKSPLAVDKATVKEFSIPEEVELHPRQKIGFLEDQLDQLKSMHWRSRVDVIHAHRLAESKVEALKNKGLQNMTQHKNEVAQTWGAIVMIQKLIEEIKSENPGLGETGSSPTV